MKKILRKIISVLMSFVVLFSTISFSVAAHYCGDTLVDLAIFRDADTCAMKAQQTPRTADCNIASTNCCSHKKITTQGQDELKTSPYQYPLDHQSFIILSNDVDTRLPNTSVKNIVLQWKHPPPMLKQDIYILNQTFLI